MTTITIERALLEQALSALLLPCDRWNGVQYRIVKDAAEALLNALAAPATAPEPICTKCGDVITAHDPGLCGCCLSTRDATSPEQKDRPINYGTGHCSCIECVMLFNAEVEESKDRKTWMHAGDYLGGGY